MRRALFTAVTMLVAVVALAGFATPASAAAGDRVRSMQIDYTVTPDGVLQVTETIAYQFGTRGRHGIYRDLVIREPYVDDDSKDQRYEVSDIKVSSSDAPDKFSTETAKENGQRDQVLRIKIGDEDETISAKEATYEIKYDVRGALRQFADHSELYWDATGDGWDAVLEQVTVNVSVPEGVQRVECFAGRAGSAETCPQKAVTDGKAVFGASELRRGEQLTIVAGIKAGAVSNDTPIVVDPPDWMERAGLNLPGLVVGGAVSLVAIAAAAAYSRFGHRDQRFAGIPPGTLPPDGMVAPPVKDDLSEDQIPVAFSPPRVPVAEGGLLIDAKATTTETAATLIDLAVRGGVQIVYTGKDHKAVLVDPAVATAPHEQVLLSGLFPSLEPGEGNMLRRRGVGDHSMRRAHDGMIKALREQIDKRGWYAVQPATNPSGGCGCVLGLGFVAVGIGVAIGAAIDSSGLALMITVPLLVLVAAFGAVVHKQGKGRRTPAGRAVADQLIGFRQYLATAEGDQLRFEEGEDIFSKYLPWAIAFDLADRWQKVCADLAAAGRIPADPHWYAGPSYYSSGWTAAALGSAVAHTFDAPPSPSSSSGGGGGSSSGFSSGSSGGGGGGGGGGSW